jgi:hypothetical protein
LNGVGINGLHNAPYLIENLRVMVPKMLLEPGI